MKNHRGKGRETLQAGETKPLINQMGTRARRTLAGGPRCVFVHFNSSIYFNFLSSRVVFNCPGASLVTVVYMYNLQSSCRLDLGFVFPRTSTCGFFRGYKGKTHLAHPHTTSVPRAMCGLCVGGQGALSGWTSGQDSTFISLPLYLFLLLLCHDAVGSLRSMFFHLILVSFCSLSMVSVSLSSFLLSFLLLSVPFVLSLSFFLSLFVTSSVPIHTLFSVFGCVFVYWLFLFPFPSHF